MLCSSLRLGHIREVRDVRTNCLQNAGKVLLVSLLLKAQSEKLSHTLEALAVNDGRSALVVLLL